MNAHTRKLLYSVGIILGGILLTLTTFIYQPDEWTIVGNACSNKIGMTYCFDLLPRAGFPIPYMHADAFSSPYGNIGFFHGIFDPVAFVIDVIILSVMVDFVIRHLGIWIRRVNGQGSNLVR